MASRPRVAARGNLSLLLPPPPEGAAGQSLAVPVAVGIAGPLTLSGTPSWRGHGAAVGHHGAAALRYAAARAAVIWSDDCVADGVAVGRRGGGREGRGDGRRRRRGMPFAAAALHLLGDSRA
jgi:hypothetical protein